MSIYLKITLIGLAGAAGTLLRYFAGAFVQSISGSAFPWGTLAVNMAGCFLFGLLWSLGGKHFSIPPEIKMIILTGFVGAFTTFSTFAFDTQGLYRVSGIFVAGANVAVQVLAGVGLVCVGIAIGTKL